MIRSQKDQSNDRPEPLKIVVLSGGTGRLGKQLMNAALAQFDDPDAELVLETEVRTVSSARRIVRRAAKDKAVICHTLVAPKIRNAVLQEAHSLMVPAVDVLGPVVQILSDQIGPARNQPGLSYELNREQFDRMDAVDFSLEHDDCRRPEDYAKADIVLVGVSRVSKSVTCLFLAYRGIRAANAAITPGAEVPEELLALDPNKVIALKMNATRLSHVREACGERWGGAMDEYADLAHVRRELADFNRLVDQHGWRWIDVSYSAVEDVASEIIHLMACDSAKSSSGTQ